MRIFTIPGILVVLLAPQTFALNPAGGGAYPNALPRDHISAEQRAEIKAQISASVARLTMQGKLPAQKIGTVSFSWPLAAGAGVFDNDLHGISNFVDQDPSFPGALLDYSCGSRTYDLSSGYNHAGIDFFTWPFGWQKMDSDAVTITAVAPGTIVYKADGNYDRSCGFGGGPWNAVYVQHADGSIAWYGHMKSGSTTSKAVGDTVADGEVLGVVGSSGNSTGPHLHLEVYDGDGNLIEPYAGACNGLNTESWWTSQRDYYDSAVNAVRTGFSDPVFPACPTTELPNTRRLYAPGENIYFSAYYHDQLISQTSDYTIRRPDGSVYFNWQHNSNAAHYAASYWYWIFNFAGQPLGTWTFEVDFEGTAHQSEFERVAVADSDGDGVLDHLDNCVAVANGDQIDANGDGYGNRCDPDLNNDGITNFLDVSVFATAFLGTDANADFNGDGVVNFLDIPVLQSLFLAPPGPSAFVPE